MINDFFSRLIPLVNAFLILAVLAVVGWYISQFNRNPCNTTLKYRIGQVDSRFSLDEEDFAQIINQAERVWEQPTGNNLFEQDPSADFTINLIFDDRQAHFLEQQQLETEIDSNAESFNKLEEEFFAKKADYERRVEALNNEIDLYNSQGGAPPEEYARLEKEKREVNVLASELTALASRYNNLADQLNIKIDEFNSDVGRIFDQGEYTGTEINIYQFEQVGDLRLVLVHEFGHALGIGHVENSHSVMYYLMQDQDLANPTLTSEDQAALTEVCSSRNFIPKIIPLP